MTFQQSLKTALIAFSVGSLIPAIALASEQSAPSLLEGEILIEIENDLTFESDDPSAEINDLFATIEAALALNLSQNLSVNSGLTFEPVRDPIPFDDRFFEDHGLYAETLFVQFAFTVGQRPGYGDQ